MYYHLLTSPLRSGGKRKLPRRRSEGNAGHLDSVVRSIHGVDGDLGSPPAGHFVVPQRQSNENQDCRQSETDVQSCTKDIVVVHPPAAPAVTNELVEDKADDTPGEVVEGSSGRDQSATTEDDGGVEVADGGLGPGTGTEVDHDRKNSTGEPEPHHVGIHLTRGEDTLRSNDTPDNGGVEKYTTVGAAEMVGLGLGADIGNSTEGPVHDSNLDDGAPQTRNHLSGKGDTRRNLHVVTKLHVLQEEQSLVHGNVTVCLEQHHGHGASRLHVTDDEFGDDVETDLDVGCGLHNTARNKPETADDQRDKESPPREMGGVPNDNTEGHSNHDKSNSTIPPDRNALETRHKTGVDIFFFFANALESDPQFFSVEETSVDKHSNDGGKGKTIAQHECGRQEERRVFLVLLQVKGVVGVQDAGDIVSRSGVVVAVRVTDGQILVIVELAVVDSWGDDPEPRNHTDQSVGNTEPGSDQGRKVETGDLSPVKGHGNQRQTGPSTKQLVDHRAIGSDPGHPGECTQEGGDKAGEPVPHERSYHSVQEKTVLSNAPTTGLGGVRAAMIMEGSEETAVDQNRRPNHSSRGDEETVEETGDTKAEHLGGDAHEDLESPAKVLTVKGTLSEQHISCVGSTTVERGIGHDDSQSMLLFAERTRVQVELEPKERILTIGQKLLPGLTNGVCDNLGDVTGDDNVRAAHREQHVQGRTDGRENHANGPGTDGVAVAAFVDVGDGSTDFGVGRVLHQFSGDAHGGGAVSVHGLVDFIVDVGG